MTNFLDIFEQELRNQAVANDAASMNSRDPFGPLDSALVERAKALRELANVVARTKDQLNEQS